MFFLCPAPVSGGVWLFVTHHLLHFGMDRDVAAGLQSPAPRGW